VLKQLVNDSNNTTSDHFLDPPEIKDLFRSVFSTLVVESDRGAVLIAATHVDLHLRGLFEGIAPSRMNRRKLKRILDYPGPLSSFSAKADIAYVTRLISEDVHKAIHHLRRVRNDVAHSPDSFRLSDHHQRLKKMYELGPGVPSAVNRWACELILRFAVDNVLNVNDPTSVEPKPIFNTPQEALDYLATKVDIMTTLDERRPRYELALGVALIFALIVNKRDRAKNVVGNDNVLAFLTRS
jgi:hypothetical protein